MSGALPGVLARIRAIEARLGAVAADETERPLATKPATKPAPEPTAESGPTRTGGHDSVSAQSFSAVIEEAARRHGVDPDLVKAVITAESGFNPNATSRAGAMGLMQLMPGTARGLGVTDAYDPVQNVDGGTRYLSGLLRRHNDVPRALASYNAGPGAVAKYGGVPPYRETQGYVRRVMDAWGRLKAGAGAPPGQEVRHGRRD